LESVSTKEIAEAVLAASGGIASLLLVFIAFLFAKADVLPAEARTRANQYVWYARIGIIPVVVCAVDMLAAYGWLFYPANTVLYVLWSIGFMVVVVLLVAYAILAVSKG
jgi:hypothetical protein